MKYRIERYRNEDSGFVDQFICSIYELDLSSGAADSDAAYELLGAQTYDWQREDFA